MRENFKNNGDTNFKDKWEQKTFCRKKEVEKKNVSRQRKCERKRMRENFKNNGDTNLNRQNGSTKTFCRKKSKRKMSVDKGNVSKGKVLRIDNVNN